jgi:1-acyl-sn-glycerol-3-phosphate acyltransferase
MIKAEHRFWAETVFHPYVSHILKKSFSNFYIVNPLPNIPKEKSLIITPNHISWWDGFFVYYTGKKYINRKFHIMVLESTLKKYWFFRKLGAFSINPQSSKSVAETFKYSREILKSAKNCLISYPQGEIEPYEKRPLALKEGIRSLLMPLKESTVVLPIGYRIEYYDKKHPALFCRFGNPVSGIEIIESFGIFEKSFYSNLALLSEAAYIRNYEEDLFKC